MWKEGRIRQRQGGVSRVDREGDTRLALHNDSQPVGIKDIYLYLLTSYNLRKRVLCKPACMHGYKTKQNKSNQTKPNPPSSQHNHRQPRLQRPRNIIEIPLRRNLKPQRRRTRRTRERRGRPVPGARRAGITNLEDPVRDIAVRPTGVGIRRADSTADAE